MYLCIYIYSNVTGDARTHGTARWLLRAQVCLSLLGTWSGEVWDPAKSSIWQDRFCVSPFLARGNRMAHAANHKACDVSGSVAVLMSIFGLIFVAEPYSPD